MREILFRGKRVDNGDWVYGSFIPDALEMLNGLDGMDGFIRRYNPESHKTDMFEVERDTVGQYTGLTDKNGVKIFEGDILSRDCYDASCRIVKIVWAVELAEFCAQTPSGGGFSMLPPNGKVIGNIHDNPELLK